MLLFLSTTPSPRECFNARIWEENLPLFMCSRLPGRKKRRDYFDVLKLVAMVHDLVKLHFFYQWIIVYLQSKGLNIKKQQ